MNFTPENQFFILLGFIAIIAGLLGWFIFDLQKKVKVIFGGEAKSGGDLQKDLLRRLTKAEAKLEEMEPKLNLVEELSKISIQKVGFLRFNPFADTGGDNSFVLALLDRANNGVIISSLYMREGIRLYAKRVENKISKQPLSDEEKKVLEDTINQKLNIKDQN